MSEQFSLGSAAVFVQQLALPVGLTLDEVTVKGDAMKIATKPFSFEAASPCEFEATISEKSLARFIFNKLPANFDDLEIHLEDGYIHAEATVRVIFPVRGAMHLILRIEDGQRIYADLKKASIAQSMIESQIEKINPVFDAADVPVTMHLESVEIADHKLVIRGTVMPPDLLPLS